MKIELHILQNFAPSCLNRDDVNAPKDCEFGGVRRARISSQCLKRSVRVYWTQHGELEGHRAVRTRKLAAHVAERLAAQGRDPEAATLLCRFALQRAGLGITRDGTTEYLLFLSERAMDTLAAAIAEHWDTLSAACAAQSAGEKPTKSRKQDDALPAEVQRAIGEIFSGRKAVDLALFGRMVADAPERNVEAACQVAHAISTHRVNVDLDFFTALDDLQPQGEPGAGMMGTVEFNSACMYRYALLDLVQLKNNLEGDAELALEAALAFLKASVQAVPSGKQNSMAAHNPPSLVMVVIRNAGVPWSLANAFQHPVTAGTPDQGGLVEQSIRRLDAYWGRLKTVYGTTGILTSVALTVEEVPLNHVGRRAANLKELLDAVRSALEENPQWRSC